MANFNDSPTFATHDDYYTPEEAWKRIDHLIPKDKIIWESCMLNSHLSKSPEYLTNLGCNVVFDKEMDMLVNHPDNFDMIITNIPFSNTKPEYLKTNILKKLVEFDKPFIIIMNGMNMFSKYIRDIFEGKLSELQIITPRKKIQYDKLLDTGELIKTNNCSFYSVYLCYKMNLTTEQLWLLD